MGAQLWIAVRRQQFAMGVDVDAGSPSGFQDRAEIAQIVAGDQDRLAGDRRDAYRRR